MRGDYPGAIALARAGVSTLVVAGGDPVARARLRLELASFLSALRRNQEAAIEIALARAELERALGAEHPELASFLAIRAEILRERGELDAAEADLDQATALLARSVSADHELYLQVLYERGWIAYMRGDHAGMLAAYQRGLEIATRRHGAGSFQHAAWEMNVGEALIDADRPADALPGLERAHAIFVERGTRSPELAMTAALLGRALRATGGDPARVRALAHLARDIYREHGFEEDAQYIDAWAAEE
jgi:tetratricopeptide (TPR) repeat protein